MKKYNNLYFSKKKYIYFLFYYLNNIYSPSNFQLMFLQLLEFFQIISFSLYQSVRNLYNFQYSKYWKYTKLFNQISIFFSNFRGNIFFEENINIFLIILFISYIYIFFCFFIFIYLICCINLYEKLEKKYILCKLFLYLLKYLNYCFLFFFTGKIYL